MRITTGVVAAALTFGLTTIPLAPAHAAVGKQVPCKVAHNGPFEEKLNVLSATFITDCREYSELVESVTLSLQIYKIMWDPRLEHAVLKSMGRGKTVTEYTDVAAVKVDTFCLEDRNYTLYFHTRVEPTAYARFRLGYRDPIFNGRNVTKPVRIDCSDNKTGEFGGWGGGGGF